MTLAANIPAVAAVVAVVSATIWTDTTSPSAQRDRAMASMHFFGVSKYSAISTSELNLAKFIITQILSLSMFILLRILSLKVQ